MEHSSPAELTPADAGEISLLLSYDPDQQVYRYRLVDSGGYYSEESATNRLLQPPGEAIEQLVAQLNTLARGQAVWDAATTTGLAPGAGHQAVEQLHPRGPAAGVLAAPGPDQPDDHRLPRRPGSLGTAVPVRPRRPGRRVPDRPVPGGAAPLRTPAPRQLHIGAADLVLSGDGSLDTAPAEIAALDQLLRARGLAARRIDDLSGLRQAFQQGELGLLHFSCHNAFARGAPNASRILLGNQPFEPVFLEVHAGRFAGPLVFLNACRTDGQAPLYTTVEGWAARFLRPALAPSSAPCGK